MGSSRGGFGVIEALGAAWGWVVGSADAFLSLGIFGALVAFVLSEVFGWLRRRRERRGLLTILDLETEQNEAQLHAYEDKISWTTGSPADNLSVGGWEGTRARLSHLLKTDEYADLAKYYAAIRVIHVFRMHEAEPEHVRHRTIRAGLPQLWEQSDLARERIRKYVPLDALDGTPLRNLTFARYPERPRDGREEASQEARGAPQAAAGEAEGHEERPFAEDAQKATQPRSERSWWRRWFGFE